MDSEGSYNILLVEDEESISTLVKSSLEARNHKVDLIDNGLQVLKKLDGFKRDSFDLVLLDINLPGANGWQILAKIRALPETKDYVVIMLTAIDDEVSESRALLDGADDYVVKPCTMKILTARIEANMRKRAASQGFDLELPFTDGKFEDLTDREKELLALVVKGYSNKEIAKLAVISELTVINHLRNIFKKLKVNTRLQAAVVALKYGLVD